MTHPLIGIFDSGVGGLTVFESIQRRLPHASIVYICDNGHFPYGPQSEQEILTHVQRAIAKATTRRSLDILVIACNTASTICLPALREQYKFPIVGVVPAIKPAAALSKTKVIGLLATPRTAAGDYIENLIREHAQVCKVIKVGAAKLAEIAERKLRGIRPMLEEIKTELLPLLTVENLDAVVLGCTHFPLLLEEFRQALPKPITWIDSSEAISLRVSSLLGAPQSSELPVYSALFSDYSPDVKLLERHLHTLKLTSHSAL